MKRLGGPAGGIKPAGGLLGLGQTVNWKPVIAAVHGYVLGAGFGLAMAADILVAAEGTQFQIREVQRGLAGAQHWATTWFWGSKAENSPTRKTMTIGIRKTYSGIVCRVSLIGRKNADTRSLRAAQIPKRPPTRKAISTAVPHKYTDSIARCQAPVNRMKPSPQKLNRPTCQPPTRAAITVTTRMKAAQGVPVVPPRPHSLSLHLWPRAPSPTP